MKPLVPLVMVCIFSVGAAAGLAEAQNPACSGSEGTVVTSFSATSATASELLEHVDAVLHPPDSNIREIEVVTRDPEGKERVWHGHEASRTVNGKSAIVLVLDSPPSVRGFAVLAIAGSDKTHEMWVYTPPVGRVRKLEYTGMAQPFLGTDLTYGDLGLFDFSRADLKLAGEDTIDGHRVKVIEAVPSDQRAYSRVLTYVTPDGWPIRREYRDVAGKPWRLLTYQAREVAAGPRKLRGLEAKDLQTGYSTELHYLDSSSVEEMPGDLFDPAALARIAEEQRLQSLPSEDTVEAKDPDPTSRR